MKLIGNLDRATDLALRACLLRLLASALTYPTPEKYRSLQASLLACKDLSDRLPKRIAAKLDLFNASLGADGRTLYELEYLRVFSHVCAADCNPCETAYTAKHIFQASQKMANITGFYQAFGLEAGGERPDHISVELEFLSFLCYRESVEQTRSRRFEVHSIRRGQKVFLERHLGKWVGTFCVLLQHKARSGPMHRLGALLHEAMRSEAARHRVALPQSGLHALELDFSDSAPSPLLLATGDFSEGVFDG